MLLIRLCQVRFKIYISRSMDGNWTFPKMKTSLKASTTSFLSQSRLSLALAHVLCGALSLTRSLSLSLFSLSFSLLSRLSRSLSLDLSIYLFFFLFLFFYPPPLTLSHALSVLFLSFSLSSLCLFSHRSLCVALTCVSHIIF